ncbi:glucoamylase family protein [Mesorhizobium sp. SB112]|uniref:glucoamylase family protein n=1 Tax=Mesorhizobium sp. SB112 TaxID=3151853 RepID=UPI003266BB76
MASDSPMLDEQADWSSESLLADLQDASFQYFIEVANQQNGLVRDRNRVGAPASIAATGMGLSALPIGVARSVISREKAAEYTLKTLRFLYELPQGPEPDASGYKGFFYHFLDIDTGRRVWNCELSTIDTAILMAGVIVAGAYFREDSETETLIREYSQKLYLRVDWAWALNGEATLTHGWKPHRGFLKSRWTGFDESLILYVLALGSPTHPIPQDTCPASRASGYHWAEVGGEEHFHAGPLFIHQMSQVWIDFRGIQDAPMREVGIDYFENSRRATYAQRSYAYQNPRDFRGYHENSWGITASDGPGPLRRTIDGKRRTFFGYMARGAPGGPDDGTLSPWATAASLPFAPEIVMPALRHFHEIGLRDDHPYGFTASFNPTLCNDGSERGWVAPEHIGINQGPIALMIENYRSGFLWEIARSAPNIVDGLRRAGFTGGWLDSV